MGVMNSIGCELWELFLSSTRENLSLTKQSTFSSLYFEMFCLLNSTALRVFPHAVGPIILIIGVVELFVDMIMISRINVVYVEFF